MDCSPPGSSVHGILQARILEWLVISSSRGSFQPRDWTLVSCITGRFFTIWATKEAPKMSFHQGNIPTRCSINICWMNRLFVLSWLCNSQEETRCGGFSFSGQSEENPIKNCCFCSHGRPRLSHRLMCREFSVYKGKEKQLNVSKQNKWWNLGWDRDGDWHLTIKLRHFHTAVSGESWARPGFFIFLAPDSDWLKVLSFHLDLNEPQKENSSFHPPFFFSTPHSFLPSWLLFLELCSNTRNQNGGISLMRAETESLWSSLGGWSTPDIVLGWSLDEKQVTDGELSCAFSLMLPISKVPSTNLGIKPGGGGNSCRARQLQLGPYWAFNFPHMCTQVQGCSRWAGSELGYWFQDRSSG